MISINFDIDSLPSFGFYSVEENSKHSEGTHEYM